jgi:hypothetical protein
VNLFSRWEALSIWFGSFMEFPNKCDDCSTFQCLWILFQSNKIQSIVIQLIFISAIHSHFWHHIAVLIMISHHKQSISRSNSFQQQSERRFIDLTLMITILTFKLFIVEFNHFE